MYSLFSNLVKTAFIWMHNNINPIHIAPISTHKQEKTQTNIKTKSFQSPASSEYPKSDFSILF